METIYTKVVGVTHRNEDGSSRQAIIKKYIDPFTDIFLEHDTENHYSKYAVSVYTYDDDNNQIQIGFLSEELAQKVYNKVDDIECYVEGVTGKDDPRKSLGVNIRLVINNHDDGTDQKAKQESFERTKAVWNEPVREPVMPTQAQINEAFDTEINKSKKKKKLTGVIVIFTLFSLLTAIGGIVDISSGGTDVIYILLWPIVYTACIVGLIQRNRWAYYLSYLASVPFFLALITIPLGLVIVRTLNKPDVRVEFGFSPKK